MAQLTQLPDDVDLAFVAGDTNRIRVRVITPADNPPIMINPTPGTPGEPGEYTFCAQIEKDPERTPAGECTITVDPDNPTSAVILTLSPTETDLIFSTRGGDEVFKGVWDLEVRFPASAGQTSGDIRTVAKGSVLCYDDVSRCAPLKPGSPGPDTGP